MRKFPYFAAILLSVMLASCSEDTEEKQPLPPPGPTDIVTPALSIAPTSQDLHESTGTPGRYHVSLNAKPKAPVTLKTTISDPTQFTLISPTATLTEDAALAGFAFYGSCLDDGIRDGDKAVTITFVTESADLLWNGVTATATANCIDDGKAKDPVDPPVIDTPSLSVTPATQELRESEKTPKEYHVTLNAKPGANVTIKATIDDPSQFSLTSATAEITPDNATAGIAFSGVCIDDNERDGDKTVTITFTTESADAPWNNVIATATAKCIDDGTVPSNPPATGIHIRFATANATSGAKESYDAPASQRILMALNADIVMLQEFKLLKGTKGSFEASKGVFDEFVSTVFGPEFEYFRGTIIADRVNFDEVSEQAKPNGIISRYPIIETGEWQSQYEKSRQGEIYYDESYYDRQWTWAVIDIPGDRDLLVVSVHLHTSDHAKEFNPLAAKIVEKQKEGNYYVVIGGDFNTKEGADGREAVLSSESLMDIFYAKKDEWPVDQNGSSKTNNKRGSPLDWVMFSHDLQKFETPTEIGNHTYPHGHVFDTRVYDKLGEIETVPPAETGDSGAPSMQHLPVIRDILLPE